MNPKRSAAGLYLLLALILILAAGLRFYRLDAQSLWNDEGNSARIAERPLADIVAGAAGDIHPPAYYILLAGWRGLVGWTEFGLRSLSALLGVLAVALIYAVGSRLFERRVGVLAALLVALSPFQIYYSQEARMYVLLALLSAASIWLAAAVLTIPGQMVTARRGGPPFDGRGAAIQIGAYVLVNALGLYTHYSFPFILLAENIAFVIWLLGRERRRHGLATWAAIQIAILLLYLPWLPHALRQISTWPASGETLVGELVFARTLAYGLTLNPEVARNSLIPLLLCAVVGLFPPIGNVDESRRYLRFAERLGLAAGWLLVPVAALVVSRSLSEAFLKFLLPANLALLLLVARGAVMAFDLGRPRPGLGENDVLTRLVALILVGFGLAPVLAGLRGLYFDPAFARDGYRAMAARIMAERGTDAGIVLDAPNQWEVFTYYYPDGPNVAPLPDAHTEATLQRLLDSYGRIYALYWGVEQQDPQRVVERTLEASAFTVRSEWYGGVRLVTYAVAAQPASQIETPTEAWFGTPPLIRLLGYTVSATRLPPGDALGITLFWTASDAIGERLKVFVHLYAPDGRLIAQHDSEPGGGFAPTDSWLPGETVVDNHGLLLPGDAPPGVYRLVVGLYRADSSRLAVTQEGEVVGDSLFLAEIVVE